MSRPINWALSSDDGNLRVEYMGVPLEYTPGMARWFRNCRQGRFPKMQDGFAPQRHGGTERKDDAPLRGLCDLCGKIKNDGSRPM